MTVFTWRNSLPDPVRQLIGIIMGTALVLAVAACSDATGLNSDATGLNPEPGSSEASSSSGTSEGDFTTSDGDAAKLLASDGSAGHWFGRTVAVSGEIVIVGARWHNSAYAFEGSEGSWTEAAALSPAQGSQDFFAQFVAGDGDIAIVSDPYHGEGFGIAYVFERSNGGWTQTAQLVASDAAADDLFGYSVDVSGNVAVVGAVGDDDSAPSAGSAYVFEASGGSWTEVAKLTAGDSEDGDNFGNAVAVDGTVVLIGAPQDDDLGTDSGSAYVFEKTNGAWTQVAKLTADDGAAGDRFGNFRSLAVDGNIAVIGAFADDDVGAESGSAFVFERANGSWTQVAKLHADDVGAGDRFGSAVDLDGSAAVVTSTGSTANGEGSGTAYLFDGTAEWSQVAKIRPSDWEVSDYFGIDVAISGDVLVVGSMWDDDNGFDAAGAAYVFDVSSF